MKPTDQDLQRLAGLRSRFTMQPARRDAVEQRILQQHSEHADIADSAASPVKGQRFSLHIAETVLAACLVAALAFGYFAVLRRLPRADQQSGESSEAVTSLSAELTEISTTTETTETEAPTDSAQDTQTETESTDAATAPTETTGQTDSETTLASTAPTAVTTSATDAPVTVSDSAVKTQEPTASATEQTVSDSESRSTASTTAAQTAESTTVSAERPFTDQLLLSVSGTSARPGDTVHIRVTVQEPVRYAGVQLFWYYNSTPAAPAPVVANGRFNLDTSTALFNLSSTDGVYSAVWSTYDGHNTVIPAEAVLMEYDLTVPETAVPGTVYTPVLVDSSYLIRHDTEQHFAALFADAGAVTVTE